MPAARESSPAHETPRTLVERTSDTDVFVTRVVNGPAHLVFAAFTTADLLARWWVPKSMPMKLVACEVDARVGGTYRLEFAMDGPETMAFYGTYLEVTPNSRLVWTNEEGGEGESITTVTFSEVAGGTRVVLHEKHPSKEALDAQAGAAEVLVETFAQLDELLATLG